MPYDVMRHEISGFKASCNCINNPMRCPSDTRVHFMEQISVHIFYVLMRIFNNLESSPQEGHLSMPVSTGLALPDKIIEQINSYIGDIGEGRNNQDQRMGLFTIFP
jgi:hypothetical protein